MENFIVFNGDEFEINKIEQITPKTQFQENCISFIEDWQSGQEYFSQHTSGSTGAPKLIEISRSQMMASAMMTIKALGLKPQLNSLLSLSPEYIAGKMMIVRSLVNKMNIIATEPALNPIADLNHKIHFAAFTPMQMQAILANKQTYGLVNNFETIILGGGKISTSLSTQLVDLKCSCYSTYGMTETVSHIALKKLNAPDQSNLYTTLDDIEINVDQRECLTIKGAVTKFQSIITNDRVNLINDHQFEWLGRVDNVINSGGIKIQSEKVEQRIEPLLNQLEVKNKFFVYGLPDDKLGEKLVLIIEGALATNKLDILKSLMKETLHKYEVPKDILLVKEFQNTPTGKIQRKETVKTAI